MNNGRPNYGNNPGWGQQPAQPQSAYPQQPQPTGYQPRMGLNPQGYQQGQGYSQMPYQQPQGYAQPYGQAQSYQPPQGFQQPKGYTQPQPYPQQGYPQGNPQQSYQQRFPQGYPQQSQQPQQGYQQGFGQQNIGYGQQPPYQQRPGYQPITKQSQSPYMQGYQYQQGGQMQGYGYTQPMQRVQPKPSIKPETVAMIVLCGILPVLFILGLVFPGMPALKWVFVALAVVSVGALWIKPLVASNVRMTFTGVYAALAIVALVSALTGTAPLDHTAAGNLPAQQGSPANSQQYANNSAPVQQQPANPLGSWTTEQPAPVATNPPADPLNNEAVEQLKSFFYFWSVNNQDNMITLCAPSWQRSVSEPKKALFSILQNRVPLEYEVEKISGTENDTARTVSVTAEIDKQNGRDPQRYRFQVIVKKEDGTWYVDPASLESNVVETTPAVTINVTPEPPPAPADATADTVLYWNESGGGSYYHLDQMCPSAKAKFLPFDGQFKFSQINEGKYRDLSPCNTCGAPLRVY